MSKLRVLYIVSGSHLYGDNRSILGTITALRENVDCMVAVTETGLFTDELDKLGIPYAMVYGNMTPILEHNDVHYTCLQRLKNRLGYWLRYIPTYVALSRVIRSFHPDIIHSNNSVTYSGAVLSHRHRIPHVWHIREYIDLDHNARIPDPAFYSVNRKRSHCIAITRGLFRHFHLDPNKDAQIYNGVCSIHDSFDYYPHKQNYFLYLGRITPSKGCDDMLEAFATFAHDNPSYQLIIVGDGNPQYIATLKAKAAQRHVNKNIEFVGYKKDVKPYLQHAKALIVPSYFEAMGRITPEAMVTGCFIVGRNTGGTKELLENEHTGLLFNTIDELTAALDQVSHMSDAELEEQNKIAQASLHRYSIEHNAQQVLDFYHKIVNQHPA